MDRSNTCELVVETYTQDDIGQEIAEETKRTVFCNVGSVGRSEWFQAGQANLKAEYVITMFEPDYEGEKIVELEGVRYGVYRTYRRQDENIELYLEEKGGV